jgi:lipooligosaccharide transport system ATP-binding protein
VAGPQAQAAAGLSSVRSAAAAVTVEDLVKRYPRSPANAVNGLSLEVRPGEVFGLLGPNGAGKSTTIGILTTRVIPTSGTARILGVDVVARPAAARSLLGVVSQVNNLDRALNGWQNLIFHAAYHGVGRSERKERAAQLLEAFQLADRARDNVSTYSGGMAQRLLIARALMHHPPVLCLDEPTTGLDPQARHLVWDRLYRLKQQGVTIVLTTHYMDEAEQLCDRLVVMDKAKIVAFGSPRDLIDQYSSREVLELRFPIDASPPLERLDGLAQRTEALPDRILLYTDDGEAAAVAIHDRGLRPESTLVRRSTLEDVFLRLTGRSLIE